MICGEVGLTELSHHSEATSWSWQRVEKGVSGQSLFFSGSWAVGHPLVPSTPSQTSACFSDLPGLLDHVGPTHPPRRIKMKPQVLS